MASGRDRRCIDAPLGEGAEARIAAQIREGLATFGPDEQARGAVLESSRTRARPGIKPMLKKYKDLSGFIVCLFWLQAK